jgi:transcriptional regulator with XRE-family HTH domain
MREKELGRVLKSMRLKQGLSAESLSRESGVSSMHIGRIERGIMSPTVGILNKIASGLGFDMTLGFKEKGKKR